MVTSAVHSHISQMTGPCGHEVRFYDNEEHLHDILSDYFAPFFLNGENWLAAIVLARARTTNHLRKCLSDRGYFCEETTYNWGRKGKEAVDECATTLLGTVYGRGQRRVFLFDADIIVASLVQGDKLLLGDFEAMLKELVCKALPISTPNPVQGRYAATPIYAYGELVDILCARGQHVLALELEAFWNRFLATENISLLCGYKMDSFLDLEVDNVFNHICQSHTTVTPTEMYSNLSSPEEKLAMIAALQVKAMKLHGKERRIRYREQFVDALCHELRNPVSGIVGNIELLQGGLDVRQAILRPCHGDDGEESIRLSTADVVLLQDQLAGDITSIDAIAACAEHMKTLSDNVLDISKLEEERVVLERVVFDARSTIISVVKMFSIVARKKGLRIHHDVPAEGFPVVGDPGRLAQVIINLVSNAVKFTTTGSITVQLRSLGRLLINDNLPTFRVVVRDTGRGLSQDEISLLFQRFVQSPSTSFAKDGGAGLGLYISKYLVELMGGAIFVESKYGEGSSFTFTFQARNYTAAEDEKPRQLLCGSPELDNSASPSAFTIPRASMASLAASDTLVDSSVTSSIAPSAITTSHSTQPRRLMRHVLVVDDNPIVRNTITRLLESISSTVVIVSTASNGYEAISKLISLYNSTSPIDLIFMDLDMPFKDGLRTTSEIRYLLSNTKKKRLSVAEGEEARCLAEVPIIGLTGDIREERFIEAKRHGMDKCIQKPVVKAVLSELIDQIARLRPSNGSSMIEAIQKLEL
jgi:signal transduction histidine kinase/CheY-like chemotaxis protein